MTESNGQRFKSRRHPSLMNTSVGRAHDRLEVRLRWLLLFACVLALLVTALGLWRQGLL